MTREQDAVGTYHCPYCENGYDGYHKCSEGTDRVEFTCMDCDEHVAPSRCASCTLDRMAEP